jgi:hypothetical protein
MGAIGSRLVLLGRLGVFVATPNASGDEIPATEVESAGYDIRVTSVHPEVLRRIAVESTELDGLEIPERTGATEVGLRTFAVAPGTFQVTLDGVPLLQRPVRIGDATPQLTVSVDSIASLGSLRGRAVGGRFLTLARMTGIVGEFVASHALSGAEPFEAGRLASGGYTLRIEFGDGRVLFREFWLDPGENLDVGDLRADDGSQIRCTAVRDLAGRTLQDVRIAPSTGGRIGGIRHPLTGDAVIEVPAGSDVLYSTSRGFAVLPGDRARQPVDLSAPFGGSVTTVEVPDDQPIPSQVLAVGAFRGELWVVDLEATGARRFSLPEALQVYGMVVSTDESWDVMQVEAAQHDRGATLVCGRRLRLAPRVGVDPAESVRIELLRLGGQDVSRLGIELDRGDLGALADDEHAIPEDCEVRIVPYDSGSVRGAIGEFR